MADRISINHYTKPNKRIASPKSALFERIGTLKGGGRFFQLALSSIQSKSSTHRDRLWVLMGTGMDCWSNQDSDQITGLEQIRITTRSIDVV